MAVSGAKLFRGIAVTVAAVAAVPLAGAGCLWFLTLGPPEPAYLNRFLVRRSTGGTHEATFYNFGKGGESNYLGATVTRPLYVNVRPSNQPFDPERGQVLAMRRGYRVRLTWKAERHLHVEYPNGAAVENMVPRSGQARITFKRAAIPWGSPAEEPVDAARPTDAAPG